VVLVAVCGGGSSPPRGLRHVFPTQCVRIPAPDFAAALRKAAMPQEVVAAAPTRTHADTGRSPVGTAPPDIRARPTSGSVQAGREARLDIWPTLLEVATQTHPHGEMLVVANGEIDRSSAPTLPTKLDSALRHPSCRTLITDLRGVQFLGARGIAVLLTIRRNADTHDVRLVLVADHQAVLRPLQLTASTDQLTLYPTVAVGRATARAPAPSRRAGVAPGPSP
jgi:anti-anti-sigma factor